MKKRILSVLLVAMLLIVPLTGLRVSAQTVALPPRGNTANLAAPNTLTLTHTHAASFPQGVPTYDAENGTITFNNINMGRTGAYTTAPSALDGKNYVLTFSTKTKGWSNTWAMTVQFAETGALSQSIAFCDNYMTYTDAEGTVHQLPSTATNGTQSVFSVYVRQEENNTCGVYIYLNGTLVGEFDKQQVLTPTLRFTGPEGADAWDPVVSELAMYATAELYGDVNGDGAVAANDASVLAKYLAGWDGYAEKVNLSNADMDQDGAVTPMDEMALHRYLSNWLGYDAPYIPTIVVTSRGVDNTGKTDVTEQLTALHKTGKRIYYPNGTYLFNGATLDFTGGVAFQSQDGVTIRNSVSDTNIVNFDDAGNLIGLMHNHLEYACTGKNDSKLVVSGNLVSPPLSTANHNTAVDFLPYWYNDFGLYNRYTTASGSVAWYDWSWNHHVNAKTSTAVVDFVRNDSTENGKAVETDAWSIKNFAYYKVTGSNPTTRPSGATTVSDFSLSSNIASGATSGSSGKKIKPGISYSTDYAIQFTTSRPADWTDNPTSIVFSTGYCEGFELTASGLLYRGKHALTYAQSSLSSASSVTYTIYLDYNDDNATRTVRVYANGQQMLNSDGTPAAFTSQIYDPALHPLLGFYRGDDATVLDWQCYWLQEYGIHQATLLAGAWDPDAWSDPANAQYWVYNLLNNAPNAKQMDFAIQFAASNYGMTEEALRASWWAAMEQFQLNDSYKDMVYCYEKDGKRYPVVFLWDEQSVRYSLDPNIPNNPPVMKQVYKDVAAAMQDAGYDGVCFLARKSSLDGKTAVLNELNAAGVMWFAAEYSTGSGFTYADQVNNFTAKTDVRAVYAVSTGNNTHNIHPSQWYHPGTSPKLFGEWVKKAVSFATADTNRPQIITCYNMAEWGEGGPGLQPTVGNGFGYLEAVRDNIVK